MFLERYLIQCMCTHIKPYRLVHFSELSVYQPYEINKERSVSVGFIFTVVLKLVDPIKSLRWKILPDSKFYLWKEFFVFSSHTEVITHKSSLVLIILFRQAGSYHRLFADFTPSIPRHICFILRWKASCEGMEPMLFFSIFMLMSRSPAVFRAVHRKIHVRNM